MLRSLVATLVAAFLAACGVSLQAPAIAPTDGYPLQGLGGATEVNDGWTTLIGPNVAGTSRGGARPLRPLPRRTPGFPF
ncbi:MAG: hypothetical protein VKQ33_00025 [Candidatus Sericytochromatia bacterium]|nr:hypothetical protein [Candidatus Sericytochromatia bacterium]